MNGRALFLAIVMGILGLFLLVLYQRRFEIEASGGERVKLLVAVKQIERGKPITEDAIATREVPQAYVEERAIKEQDRAKVLQLKVSGTVKANQTLMWTDLVSASEDRRDLSSLVQPGYRAVSVRTAREDSSIALIRPGDYVDVVGVLGPSSTSEQRSSVVLLQKVLVLAIGADMSADKSDRTDKAYDRDTLLTLSLTLTQAQVLALASEKGRLTVALRNPDDSRVSERTPDIGLPALLDPKDRAAITTRTPIGPVRIPENGGNQ
jgi:pilus assembly protein CpaB